MKLLSTITAADIRKWHPCDVWCHSGRIEAVFASHGLEAATPLEIAQCQSIPPVDRLWLLLRENILPASQLRLFACWCARQALTAERNAGHETDARSWTAIDVAERFIRGAATEDELFTAAESAWSAAAESMESVAAKLAWWPASRSADSAAVGSAAESAKWSAARSAESAAESAWSAAAESVESVAARLEAARSAQLEHLCVLIEGCLD